MIYFTKEGAYKRIGLNFYISAGGFVLGWVWYNVRARELYGWRFRFRYHIRPWFLFSRNRQSIIHSYLFENDAVVIERALIQDYAPNLEAIIKYRENQGSKDRLDKLMSV